MISDVKYTGETLIKDIKEYYPELYIFFKRNFNQNSVYIGLLYFEEFLINNNFQDDHISFDDIWENIKENEDKHNLWIAMYPMTKL